jgi:uncharacterized protein with ATP-grasp and redox domains
MSMLKCDCAECVPCFVRQAAEALALCVPDGSKRADIMRQCLTAIADAEWNVSPTVVAQRVHRQIRECAGAADPYRSVKDRMNRLAIELLPRLQAEGQASDDPIESAVRIAIVGNLFDSGAKTSMTESDIRAAMRRVFTDDLTGSALALLQAAQNARQILYLTDNAGEIVFDRAVIEVLPAEKMFVGVRGAPVLNDATEADAAEAGLPQIVPVLPNGSDAPGTLIEDCSEEFRRIFETSDLVIAKGQGNYESLSATDKHIFFLLRVKCSTVAEHIGAPVGAMVIREMNGLTFDKSIGLDQEDYDSDYVG